MVTVGVDIVEIKRIAKAVDRWGERFLKHVYTPKEVEYSKGRVAELAVRFAGKEAVSKALGTGIHGLSWPEIEILPDRRGKPEIHLHGRAKERARSLQLTHWVISLSHCQEYAIAFVVASGTRTS